MTQPGSNRNRHAAETEIELQESCTAVAVAVTREAVAGRGWPLWLWLVSRRYNGLCCVSGVADMTMRRMSALQYSTYSVCSQHSFESIRNPVLCVSSSEGGASLWQSLWLGSAEAVVPPMFMRL
jgi:hypothetical protein